MIEIPLTKGKVALISDEDADLADFNWSVQSDRYAKRIGPRPTRKMISMHRVIGERAFGDIAGLVIDHINGDGFDNRRENLRAVTHSENLTNVGGAQKNSKSGVLGVSYYSSIKKWAASIKKDGQQYQLGRYLCFGKAVQARKKAEIRLHGLQPRRVRA